MACLIIKKMMLSNFSLSLKNWSLPLSKEEEEEEKEEQEEEQQQ